MALDPSCLSAHCYNTLQMPLSYIHSKVLITILRLQENVPQRVTMALGVPNYSTTLQPPLVYVNQSTVHITYYQLHGYHYHNIPMNITAL
jgi:hypothetical protein